MNNLYSHFERAWFGVGCKPDARPAFDRLLTAYAESHRHYHTIEHIEACLDWLDKTRAQATRPHEVALAIWYHDAIYDPRATDNESRSSQMANVQLALGGAYEEAIDQIADLVYATHDHAPATGDTALLIDIDLASLGAPPDEFARNEANIRAEYAAVPDRDYAIGHAAVLRRLAARTPLYSTPVIAAELEAQARVNLAAAIARWEAEAK
jgi:predicted metal-dependent HD superfamily phosphohydrolase